MEVDHPPLEEDVRADHNRLPRDNEAGLNPMDKDQLMDDNRYEYVAEDGVNNENIPMAVDQQEEENVSSDYEEVATDDTNDSNNEELNRNLVARRESLAPFLCNICKKYVDGAVITICGHLFCWTCLWPRIEELVHPCCPQCQRHLNMYEDIFPFHGEGPNTNATDNDVVAQPENVARPSGLYFNKNRTEWFAINGRARLAVNAPNNTDSERNLYKVLKAVSRNHLTIGLCLSFLNCMQYIIAILMFILWGMFSLH